MSYLKKLPIHKLKIDQSFVAGLPEDRDDISISRAVIALGKSLGLSIVAEGVETESQAEFLAKESCDELQGYLFLKPVPAETFVQLLQESAQD
ncbi:hypothetical protein BOW53_16410 [Solemya pervernicosa gill symbiont]|uniref:EAL domain-containing protein n=2 Tax=Gammaproteobacteria incertae sedis TaxID=118884 RepID=A0A1T2KZH1_9GAMM|nr:hypothetical protein BOW53_16410 [Solemya pervernicosa gill symbiont]QKQ26688.1 EAL domain-containing protein [Candidatus Reidiella endopervernicosa]